MEDLARSPGGLPSFGRTSFPCGSWRGGMADFNLFKLGTVDMTRRELGAWMITAKRKVVSRGLLEVCVV